MWIKKHTLYQTLSCALASLFVCAQCAKHTHQHKFLPDLKSCTLTPGVPVQSGCAILPLTGISTCCLKATSTCFSSDRNQSDRHKASAALLCVWVHTHCAHKMHTHTQSHTVYNNKKKLEENTWAPDWCFLKANKVQRQRRIIWQKEGMWQCVFRGLVLLTPANESMLLKLTLKAMAEQ